MKRYVLFLLLLVFFSSVVIATGITMNPQEQTLNKGDTFLLEVNVTDITSLYSFEIIFSFDNLQFNTLTEGTFLSEDGSFNTSCTGPTHYTSNSYIYTCIREFIPPYSGVSGSGNLALIEFNVTSIPPFDNLRNFNHLVNTQFSESITAESIGEYWINLTEITFFNSSLDEIEYNPNSFINGTATTIIEYSLNDTSFFNIDSSTGLITNVTPLDSAEIYYLNISIVDDIGNENSGIFYITTYDSYPVFSNYYDNSGTLSGSGLGLFNVTVENTNGTVILTINNTDILATNLTSNVYNASYYFDSYGTYNYSWYSWSNESTNNYNETGVMNYIVVDDTIYPVFSSYYDNSGTLSGSGTGYFNVTVANTNGTVLLEINGVNITSTNLTSNMYNVSYEFASPGIYNYLWHSWGNGTSEAYNNSGIRSYSVINSTVNTCSNLSTANIVYKLSNNVNATGTCFTVSAQNITLDCQGYKVNYSSAGTSGYGVYSTQFNTTIKNCNIIEGTSASRNYHAVYFNGATNGAIKNNTISPSGQSARGILLTSGSNFNLISNNIISTTAYGGEGISLSSNFNLISNNIISTSGSYGYGILLTSSSSSNMLLNNTISSSSYSIFLSSSSNNNFSSNNISSNIMSFYLEGDSPSYFTNKIENDNYVSNKLVNVIDGSENLEFDGVDFTQYGQVIVMNSRNITIKNSEIPNNGITYANSNGTIENNNIIQGHGFGVYLVYSKESNVINNTISTNMDGIKLSSYSDSNLVSHNTISNSGYTGISLSSSSNNNLLNNTISAYSYGGSGISLSSSSNNNFISNNIISTSGSHGTGVYLYRSSNNNIKQILVTTLSGSDSHGLYVNDDSYDNIIESSNFTTAGSTSYGVYIQTDKTNTTMTNSVINALIVNDIYVGNDQDPGSFLKLINVSFDKSDVTILEPQTFDLIVQYYLDVNVTDFATGTPLQSASVKGYDNQNNLIFSDLTTSNGFIPRKNLTEYTQNITGKFFLTNYKINTTLVTYDDSVQSVNMSNNVFLDVKMEGGVIPEDYEYPIFSTYRDNNGTLTGNGTGYFNVTVENTNGTVILHINGDNIPATNLTSNVYNASYYFSSSGIYSYNWTSYGNGTFNNPNISDNQNYVINELIEDTTPPLIDFTYPTSSSGIQSENSTYVNISSSDSESQISTFVDFNNSLVFWMRMDEHNSTTVYDNSSYKNNGVITGATYTSSGKFGGAYNFDGDADYIISSPQWNYSSTGFTYSLWIKSTGIDDVPLSHSSSSYSGAQLWSDNQWYSYNGGWISINADRQTDNQWHMYTYTWNKTTVISYRNGNQVGITNAANLRFYPEAVLAIGKDRPGSTSYFSGSIDEVMIFSRALSISEINALYNSTTNQYHNNFTNLADGNYTFKGYAMDTAGNVNTTETRNILVSLGFETDTTPPAINFTYPTPSDGDILNGNSIYVNISSSDSGSQTSTFVDFNNSLLGWWRMDEHNSTTVYDNSSYKNNGVITGATYTSSGKFGGAYSFDGVNDYVTVGTGSNFNMTGKNFSISVWVRQFSATSNAVPVGKVTPASEGWMFYQADTGNLLFWVYNFDDDTVSMGESLPLNEWTHLVGLSNSTSTCIYKNGVLITCDSKGVGSYVESGSALRIGRYDDYDNYFNGSVDEVMIFDRALSNSEISSLYNSTANQYHNNFTSLSNGNFPFKGYAMDTAGNINSTEQRTAEVYINTSSGGDGENDTYYIDSGATGSNNGNDWGNAWTGFSQINWNLINPGDTLYITGTFHETLNITQDGISVIGVNSPIIYGAKESIGTTGDWSDLGSNIWQHSLGTSDYIFVWFEISGETLWGVSDSTPDSTGEWTKNGNSIQVYSTSNPALAWDSMYYGDVDIGIKIDADNVVVSGIDVKYTKGLSTTGEYKSDGAIVVTPAHNNISISNCHLQHVPLGFNAITTSNTITLNNVDVTGVYNPYLWPGGVGYMWYNHHIEAYNFSIAMDITTAAGNNIRNGEGIRIPIDDSAAGYTTYFPDYSYIHDFDISGFSITGIKGSHQVDSGNREFNSFVISDGVIHDSVMSGSTSDDRDGIGFGGTSAHGLSGVVVERMKIYNVWHSGVKFVDNWYDCVVKNSIIYNVGYVGGNQAGIVVNKGSYILFTTIDNYQDGYGIIVDDGGQSSRLSEIQYTSLSGGTDAAKVAITAVNTNLTNLYYVNIYDTNHTDADKLYGGIVGKVGVTYENPLFTNRASNDYTLTSSSPFIDVSDSVIIPVSDDFDSSVRPVNDNYDIGAYEYTGEAPTPDNEYPVFYNITDNNASLEGSGTVTITANINNTNGVAGVDFDGANYTMSNVSNYFSVSFTKSGEGTYAYYLWAYGNGTSGNYNNTIMRYYIINSIPIDLTFPLINFTYPTPSDSFLTMNTSIEINVSITEQNLKEVKFNWNGTNYSILDSSTMLFMNFNNISSLGENSTYVADLSTNGNNGVIVGKGGFVNDAERGTVLDLNGGMVNVSDSSSLDIQNEITLSAWINLRASSDYPKIFMKFVSVNDPWELYTLDLKGNTRMPRFILTDGIAGGDSIIANSSTALSLNEWHNLLGTYDGNNVQLYVDGVLVDSKPSNIVIGTNDLPLFVGRTFNGTIDDVMILNKSLSFDEVQELYFSRLNRYNSTIWNLYINQSKNSVEGLDEGTYEYQAFVSDTSGYTNQTEQRIITVSSAPDFIPPYFTSIPAGEEISYGTDWNGVQFNADDENEINSYNVNDSRFTINSSGFLDSGILGADNYFLNISVSDTSNNLNSTVYNLNITKAIPAGILVNNESWAEVYGTSVSITYSENNLGDGDLIYTIYRDDISKGTEDTALLGVGEYNYILNTTGGQNYTANASMDMRTMTITSQGSVAILNFNETSSVNYGTYLNVTCNGELFRDDVNVTDEIGSSVLLGAGTYSYSCKLYADGNHSYDDDNQTFVVNQNPNDFTYLLNGVSSSLSISYLQQINATILNNNTASAILLDGEALISGINYTIGAGTWTINYSVSGNQNYTSNEHSLTLQINKLSSSVYLNLNNSRNNLSINYGNIVELSGVLNSGEGNITLYVDNSIVNQGNNLGNVDYNYNFTIPGVYNVTALYFPTQNYSFSSETFYVTAVNSSVAPVISLLSPSEGASYTLTATTFQYFVTDDSATNCSLIINGEIANFNSSVSVDGKSMNQFINSTPVGGYTWSVNCTDIFNNPANSSLINFRIAAATDNNNGNGGGGGGGGGGSSSNAGWTKTQVVTEEQFREGSQKELEIKQRVKVTIGSEAHYVGILNLTQDSAVIEIASDPMVITLNCGEERKVDCTGDGFYDMYIKLCDITNKMANLTIKSINEKIPSVTGDTINEPEEPSGNAANESSGENHWWNSVIPRSFINNPVLVLIPVVLIIVMGVILLSSSKSSRFLKRLKFLKKRRLR